MRYNWKLAQGQTAAGTGITRADCRATGAGKHAGERREKQPVAVWQREQLAAGFSADGPLLLTDANSTIVVDAGWQLKVLNSGALLLTDQRQVTAFLPCGK